MTMRSEKCACSLENETNSFSIGLVKEIEYNIS